MGATPQAWWIPLYGQAHQGLAVTPPSGVYQQDEAILDQQAFSRYFSRPRAGLAHKHWCRPLGAARTLPLAGFRAFAISSIFLGRWPSPGLWAILGRDDAATIWYECRALTYLLVGPD